MTIAPSPSLVVESLALEGPPEQWVEIEDPVSGNIFYANPATGECSWEQPVNADIKPRDPTGEWWELFDETHGLPYYYNTHTGQTDWLRPEPAFSVDTPRSSIYSETKMSEASIYSTQHTTANAPQHYRQRSNHSGGGSSDASSGKHGARLGDSVTRVLTGRCHQISCSVIDEEPDQADHASRHRADDASSMSRSGQSSRNPTSLPTDLRDDPMLQFQIDGFAKKHFAIHKKGIFRRKVPVEKMLQWTKESLKLPLLTLNKNVHRDALKIFKIIQRIMGDRQRMRGSTALDDIQWLLDRGLQQSELRDEIYVQLCKQVTNNPSRASVFKGWELMSVLAVTFPSSKNFEDYLKNFIQQHYHETDRVDILARHCYKKLMRTASAGPRGKAPTFGEIEHAKAAAFNPSVFGENLETIMEMQAKDFPDLHIPRILAFLAESILEMNGEQSEGIFRVPGDVDYVTNLKLRIEKGNYDMSGIRDPNVPASTLKFWLRDLAEPLIPGEYYRECIGNAEDPQAAFAMIEQLPEVNRRVAEYLIGFLQVFARPECSARTKMHIDNLAMVFAPSFLRCPTSNLTQIFENTRHEQAFVKTLIIHLPCQPPPVSAPSTSA
ncbi:Rho GTPase activation protein [Thamnocephalis sphaerospora]|uniref:Rho GTPase activation protein n=1 Tax=Thamnocephalis sphaerospora TaxID=78915 RepID=A0A4P9XX32_9FUNG|nr:Rho GTPase activation protein [Thamnocephalis sphaerospora]|eukprot:RKP10231.1 Rho GTPase activation protein [Thamnocephalis sphaerospora]